MKDVPVSITGVSKADDGIRVKFSDGTTTAFSAKDLLQLKPLRGLTYRIADLPKVGM